MREPSVLAQYELEEQPPLLEAHSFRSTRVPGGASAARVGAAGVGAGGERVAAAIVVVALVDVHAALVPVAQVAAGAGAARA